MKSPTTGLFSLLLVLAAALPAQALDRFRVWHEGREITVVDRGGVAVHEGDIIIGRTAEVLERSRRAAPNGQRVGGGSLAKSNSIGSDCCRWPRGPSGLFEVPYVIESDPDGSVPAALNVFNQQLSGFMRAVPRTNQPDYVAFTLSATDDSGACASNIGVEGGRQEIVGSHGCGTGVLVHEMGHAIGLFHEQVHVDGPRYVVIDQNSVDPEQVHNYQPHPNRRSASPYDFASLMHYPSGSFSREGRGTLETIPAGIYIGQRNGFSAADIEGIKRFYGEAPEQITVTTNPAGLAVIVDGVQVQTPAVFNWAIGSTHTLDVPANAQVSAGNANVFGRWNVDFNGDLAARRTITVTPGNGSLTAPTNRPAISTYTANFVRYKEVRISATGGGSVVPTPAPTTLQGVSGVYYRERQPFALDAFPSGNARLGGWGGPYGFTAAYTSVHSPTFRGPLFFLDSQQTAYNYTATFVDFPFVTLRARAQDGDVLGISVSNTRGSSAFRLPYNSVNWSVGETVTVTAPLTTSPFSDTMRYVFLDWDGNPARSLTLANPTAPEASRTVTANFSKEYQAYKEVIPACGGQITLPGSASAWYPHGSSLAVSLTVNPGWVMTGWEGSLSGTSPTGNIQVTTHPNLVARLNTTNAPLAVTSVSPATAQAGQATTIAIDGSGFTPATEVYVNGERQASTFVGGNRLTANVTGAALSTGGLAIVTVANRTGSGCTVSESGGIDVLGLVAAAASPQTGWWWNANESGRGFFIEKRGNNLFMAGYYYEQDGRATWFSAAGPMSGSSFSGEMTTYRGGQTLTGTYRGPTAGTSPGQVTLTFNSSTTATMTWPGGTTTLTRFSFGGAGGGTGENGWWWSSAESGRGYSIEVQGTAIFMAGFMYDDAGNPVWYATQGTLGGGSVFNGAWQQFGNGQPLGGTYRAPSIINGNVGSIGLAFTGSRSATLTLPNGRQVGLTRFEF